LAEALPIAVARLASIKIAALQLVHSRKTQVPDIDVILVPVGGGGLIAGVSLAVKTLHPEARLRTA
jgi:threonine dehydratase